jgi:hypothetical protein
MHHYEAPRRSEQIAHFCEPDFVAGEDEDVQHYLSGHHASDERIVIALCGREILQVLSPPQLLRRTHLLLEISRNGDSWTHSAGIPHTVNDPR